jgi:hypothetical protein
MDVYQVFTMSLLVNRKSLPERHSKLYYREKVNNLSRCLLTEAFQSLLGG